MVAFLTEAFAWPYAGNQSPSQSPNQSPTTKPPICSCGSTTYDMTDDGNKTCSCPNCGHIFWQHGVTRKCGCNDCLNTSTTKAPNPRFTYGTLIQQKDSTS